MLFILILNNIFCYSEKHFYYFCFMMFIVILFVVLVGGGWLIGKLVGEALFPNKDKSRITYIDNSFHHHYHEHKNISIIDDTTKQKIFDLKESKEDKKATN